MHAGPNRVKQEIWLPATVTQLLPGVVKRSKWDLPLALVKSAWPPLMISSSVIEAYENVGLLAKNKSRTRLECKSEYHKLRAENKIIFRTNLLHAQSLKITLRWNRKKHLTIVNCISDKIRPYLFVGDECLSLEVCHLSSSSFFTRILLKGFVSSVKIKRRGSRTIYLPNVDNNPFLYFIAVAWRQKLKCQS